MITGITIGIIVIALVMFAFSVLFGLKHGFWKSLVHLGAVILAAFGAMLIAKALSSISAQLTAAVLNSLPKDFETISEISEFLTALLKSIAGSLIYVFVFVILLLLLKIPEHFIRKALPEDMKKGKLYGMGIAAVTAVIVIAFVFSPLAGYVRLADSVTAPLNNVSESCDIEEIDTVKSISNNYITPIASNPVLKVSNGLCGFVFDSFMNMKVGNVSANLVTELVNLSETFVAASPLLGVEAKDFGTPQAEAFKATAEKLGNSELITDMAGKLVSLAASSWKEGKAFADIESPFTEETSELTDGLVDILAASDGKTVKSDLNELANLFEVIVKYDALRLFDENTDAMEILKTEGLISDTFATVYSYERFRSISASLYNYAISMASESLNLTKEQLASLKLDPATLPDIADENIKSECDKIEQSVLLLIEFAEELGKDEDILKTNLVSLGKALDTATSSPIIGSNIRVLLDAVLKSEKVKSAGVLKDNVIDKIVNTEGSFETILGSTSKAATIIESLKKPEEADKPLTEEEKEQRKEDTKEAIGWLADNMDTETAEMLSEIMTPDLMSDYGVSDEKSEHLSNVVTGYFDSLAKADGISQESLEAESKCVEYLFTIATTASEAGSDDPSAEPADSSILFNEETGTADEIIDNFMKADVLTTAIRETVYGKQEETPDEPSAEPEKPVIDPFNIAESVSDDDKEQVTEGLKNYTESNYEALSEEEKDVFEQNIVAIASIFGMDITEDFASWIGSNAQGNN